MALEDALPRGVLALLVAGSLGVAFSTDLPRLSDGHFWGDGATYTAAAMSLVEDHDLEYEARDAARVRREFSSGAQGIFLKRASGGFSLDVSKGFPWLRRVTKPRIYFAKAFLYPVLAAPFVWLFGTKGLLLANAIGLDVALLCAYTEIRRRESAPRALAAAASLVLLTVAPVYLFWPSPEAMSMGLVAAGLWAWRRRWIVLSTLLFGLLVYAKYPNVLLAVPLGLEPLLDRASPWGQRLAESVKRGGLVLAFALALFGANAAVTGEWNYQGGRERKTFYGVLPFEDHGVTFGNSGIWMSTNQFGPSVEGVDTKATSQGQEPPRKAGELAVSFLWNLFYFWFGRFGGILPYFLPFAAAAALFLFVGPREKEGGLVLLAFVLSWLLFIEKLPDNWYGGSGTLGNRYFLNLLPLAAFLVPRGRGGLVALAGLVGACLFTGGLLAHPIRESLAPGDHAMGGAFSWMPPELTMLNDLSVFGETWRRKRPVGHAHSGGPGLGDEAAYYLYFPDNLTWGREERGERLGFWLKGGTSGEVYLRAIGKVRAMHVRVEGGPAGDEVTLRVGGTTETLRLSPGEERQLQISPGEGFPYKDTSVYVLHLRSTRGEPPRDNPDPRALGAFVSIDLETAPMASATGPRPADGGRSPSPLCASGPWRTLSRL